MSAKTPIRATFTGSEVSGLAEYQSGEFIDLSHGGLGASLSIGTTGQVLKVNSGGTALEFGNVEAVINIDTANDLTGSTLVSSDQILLSDGGTEGRVTLSQLDTLFSGTTQTLTNKTFDANGTGNSISNIEVADFATGVLDTDLSSVAGTDTTLASAKAIKAYVDAQNANQMTTFTISDDSSTTSTITQSDTLQFLGGTGIGSTVSGDTVTFAIDNTVATLTGSQTLQNKVIDSANNTLTLDLSEGTLTGTTAEFNSALSDGSFATLAGSEQLSNKTINSSNNTITIDGTEATLSNIGNASLSNSAITISDGSNSTATSLGGTITIQGTANEVEVAESSGTVTVGLPDDVTVGGALTVTGNLTVNGTTTTISTTNTVASDTLFELGNGTTGSPANDTGIVMERGDSDNAFIGFDESADKFIVGTGTFTGASTGNLSITTGTLVANLEATTATLGGSNVVSTDNTLELTNKTIDASSNTISNIGNSQLTSGIDAAKISSGSVSNTEFDYLDGVTSSIQTQIDNRATKGFAIAMAIAL
jgi:hypothetical protein